MKDKTKTSLRTCTRKQKQKEIVTMTIQQLEQVIARYGTEIYSFCIYLTKDQDRAEELYQETWLTITRNTEKIENSATVKSYILSVVIRIWKNQKRKIAWRSRIAPTEQLVEEAGTGGGDMAEDSLTICLQKERKQEVERAVSRLSEKYQIVVMLYYMEELSVEQIAKILSIPQGTVKSRLAAARKKLGQELEAYIHA